MTADRPAPEPRPVTGVGAGVGLSATTRVVIAELAEDENAETRLTDAEVDLLRQALRRWLPHSYEGGVGYIRLAVEAILRTRLAALRAEPDSVDDDTAGLRARVEAIEEKWEQVRFYEVAAMQLRNSFLTDLRAALAAADPAGDERGEGT